MKITKITLYQLPFTFESGNRIDNIQNLKGNRFHIPQWELTEQKDFSWNFTNFLFNATLTVNTNQAVNLNNRPQGFNYVVIYAEGLNNALPNSIPGPAHEIGFFLQSVSKFNNSQSYQYNCRVDVFGTWGLDYMSALEGTLVNVKRMHEDRWVKDGDKFKINLDSHFLINSDFTVPDTKGMEMKYVPKKALIWGADGNFKRTSPYERYELKIDVENAGYFEPRYFDTDNSNILITGSGELMLKTGNIDIDNVRQNQFWYVYAILKSGGKPITNNAYEKPGTFQHSYDTYSLAIVKPQSFLNCFYNETNEPKDFSDLNKKCNASNIASDISSLKNFEVLQEGKIVNMIISPFPIDNVEDALNGKTSGYNNMKRICFKNDGSNSSCADSDHQIGVVNWNRDGYYKDNTYGDLFFSGRVEPFEISEIGFTFDGDAATVKTSVDPVLLNQSIVPITFKYKENEVILDVYNYLKNPIVDKYKNYYVDPSKYKNAIISDFNITPQGIYGSINISKNQFMDFSDTSYYSYNTESGNTYLTQNKNSIDGNKKLIDLQMQKEQIEMSKQYGSGVSFWDPATWVTGVKDAGLEAGAQYLASEIASQEKANIDAGIRDSFATAPNAHLGNDNEGIHRHVKQNLKGKFNFIAKFPNSKIINNIRVYANKYGYKIDDYIKFDTQKMIYSRKLFNYIQVGDVSSALGKKLVNYDNIPSPIADIIAFPELINEFASILEHGVRVWRTVDIDYDPDKNYEIILDDVTP